MDALSLPRRHCGAGCGHDLRSEGLKLGQQNIRAHDYWKRGVVLPGETSAKAYLLKPGTSGITPRNLELHGMDYVNSVHKLDEVQLWPGMGLVHQVWVQEASGDRREK